MRGKKLKHPQGDGMIYAVVWDMDEDIRLTEECSQIG